MKIKNNLILAKYVIDVFPSVIYQVNIYKNHLVLTCKTNHLYQIVNFLKFNSLLRFTILSDICGVHYISGHYRIIYNLLSIETNQRVFIQNYTIKDFDSMPSLISMFSSAPWLEREVFDMFGLLFKGHDDIRRILTDYGFRGQPLLKNFPLVGFVELRYDDTLKYIVYEPIEFSQTFRYFENFNPWQKII